ncbi:ArsR family transcriptional regulator [Spirillospora sp. CA-294931]|uniref:ArsR/SmtB family transcription factor n=1 Tax=Spirillospora sp. CA-294931 TaxID=3240042 RepID=UPI003D8EEF2A
MGLWEINADTLARCRFVVSPLAETTSCLFALNKPAAGHPAERAWLNAHLPAFRALLADDPITALLLRSVRSRTWNADFVTPTPTGEGTPTFEEEVVPVREAAPDLVQADLEATLGGPPPAALRRTDLGERMAGLLEWVWRETVLPSWPTRRRVLEADIVARTRQLGQGGWAAALDDIHPGMRWLGENRLQVNAHDYPPRELSGALLLLVPVTPAKRWISWDDEGRHAVVYQCSGTLALGPAVPGGLGRLIGPARAGVLVRLDAPKSTSQLVALTGQGLGSVGRHLKVLLDAGLVTRRRAGRAVLYYRTAAGDALVRATDT